MPEDKIIAVLGPTASGKTSLAVALAKKFDGEIISADSRQVYIGMDVGTGKEGDPQEIYLAGPGKQPARMIDDIPQYLVDLLSPSQTFSVADFQSLSKELIQNMFLRHKLPIITGGTGLYVSTLLKGYQLPEKMPWEEEIFQQVSSQPIPKLLALLRRLDPSSYEQIDHRNKRRLIRPLVVTLSTGLPFSSQKFKQSPQYDALCLAIDLPRKTLYQRIDKRVDSRIKQGMIEEVSRLLQQGVSPQKLIAFGLEYKFITQFLIGEMPDRAKMIQNLKFAIHAYARRQLIWLRRQLPVVWVKSLSEAEILVTSFLSK